MPKNCDEVERTKPWKMLRRAETIKPDSQKSQTPIYLFLS